MVLLGAEMRWRSDVRRCQVMNEHGLLDALKPRLVTIEHAFHYRRTDVLVGRLRVPEELGAEPDQAGLRNPEDRIVQAISLGLRNTRLGDGVIGPYTSKHRRPQSRNCPDRGLRERSA